MIINGYLFRCRIPAPSSPRKAVRITSPSGEIAGAPTGGPAACTVTRCYVAPSPLDHCGNGAGSGSLPKGSGAGLIGGHSDFAVAAIRVPTPASKFGTGGRGGLKRHHGTAVVGLLTVGAAVDACRGAGHRAAATAGFGHGQSELRHFEGGGARLPPVGAAPRRDRSPHRGR